MLRCNINTYVHKTNKENTMKIKEWIKSLFNGNHAYESGLEQYLRSKKPASVADIEHWITIYHRQGGLL